MSTNLIIQYTFVGLILLAVAVALAWKFLKLKNMGAPKGGCGCALSESCGKKQILKKSKNKSCHEENKNME